MIDPVSQTKAEAALHERLIAEIVDPEVMGPMEKIGWQHGAPPPPEMPNGDNPQNASTQPNQKTEEAVKVDNPPSTPAETAATTTDVVDWDSLKEPNGLYAGKYKTKEELLKGMSNVVAMAKQAFTERDAAIQRELENSRVTQPAPVVTETPIEPVVKSTRLDEVLNQIVAEGGTLDEKNIVELRTALLEDNHLVAERIVQKMLNDRDSKAAAETSKWNNVDAYMRDKYPESVNFTNELGLFVRANPLIAAGVDGLIAKGREREATEFAYLEFRKTHQLTQANEKLGIAEKTEVQLTAAEQVRKEAVEQARRDAGVVSTTASGVHENVDQGASPDEVEMAANEMRRTGTQPGTAGGARWRQLTIMKELENDPLAKSIFG